MQHHKGSVEGWLEEQFYSLQRKLKCFNSEKITGTIHVLYWTVRNSSLHVAQQTDVCDNPVPVSYKWPQDDTPLSRNM